MTKPEKILYTAHATSTGGRDGTSKTDDGILDVKLTTPKGLGGNGAPGTNPEQLFAAGYSACFIGAMKFVAMQQKVALPADTSISADESLDAEQRAETGRRLKAIGAQIEQLEARWLELSTQLDDIAESVG